MDPDNSTNLYLSNIVINLELSAPPSSNHEVFPDTAYR